MKTGRRTRNRTSTSRSRPPSERGQRRHRLPRLSGDDESRKEQSWACSNFLWVVPQERRGRGGSVSRRLPSRPGDTDPKKKLAPTTWRTTEPAVRSASCPRRRLWRVPTAQEHSEEQHGGQGQTSGGLGGDAPSGARTGGRHVLRHRAGRGVGLGRRHGRAVANESRRVVAPRQHDAHGAMAAIDRRRSAVHEEQAHQQCADGSPPGPAQPARLADHCPLAFPSRCPTDDAGYRRAEYPGGVLLWRDFTVKRRRRGHLSWGADR